MLSACSPFCAQGKEQGKHVWEDDVCCEVEKMPQPFTGGSTEVRTYLLPATYRQELTDIFKCFEVFFFFSGKFWGIVVDSHAMARNHTDSMYSLPSFSLNNVLQNYRPVLQS